MNFILAHNVWTSSNGAPVILENPDAYPFSDGERERDWHEASEAEIAAYVVGTES